MEDFAVDEEEDMHSSEVLALDDDEEIVPSTSKNDGK